MEVAKTCSLGRAGRRKTKARRFKRTQVRIRWWSGMSQVEWEVWRVGVSSSGGSALHGLTFLTSPLTTFLPAKCAIDRIYSVRTLPPGMTALTTRRPSLCLFCSFAAYSRPQRSLLPHIRKAHRSLSGRRWDKGGERDEARRIDTGRGAGSSADTIWPRRGRVSCF